MHDDVFKNPVHTIPPFLFFSSTFFPSSPTAGRYCYYYTTLTNKFKPAGFSKRPEKGHKHETNQNTYIYRQSRSNPGTCIYTGALHTIQHGTGTTAA